ncbi:amidohydrolase family protein [Acuticoccus sp. MNP-M23]|uniref:amidohydrolase family protein n=1 Tax=Acuticoccus sp. MNP-M23 TaxID=3072793 RepID=UPI0028151BB0|nr:amidohydrolase family protein [Acuticoccus sp. MNP-M23]WMS43060.1 amidohydrolase family protein [Acuticoccus sp. MNP-M23]
MSAEFPIVDAHHHIWRRADLPWLLGPTQPRIFGPYDAIKRDYLIDEYREDVAGSGVAKSVYVQANWAPNWFADEARWVADVAAETGWPHAIVAFCDITQDDARADLDTLAGNTLVRGIRHQMHHHHNPLYRFASGPDVVGSAAVIRNVQRLADYAMVFELQIFAGQVDAALRLVDECPDVIFVLQHAGMPEDLTDEGKADWREAIGRLAKAPNVLCKLSGFGTFIHANDPAHIAWTVAESLEMFGATRCLYGSNFPIEKLWTSYDALIGAVKDALADAPDETVRAVFHDTAAKVYRL